MEGVWINRDFWPISRFISEMIQVRAIVTKECVYETVPKLSNGAVFNDLEWPLTQISRSQYYLTSNNSKWYTIQLYLQWQTNNKSYMVYQTALFSTTLNDPCPRLQGHAIIWCWVSQKRYEIGIVSMEYYYGLTRPTQQRHFKWSWVILSDLAKYSIIIMPFV